MEKALTIECSRVSGPFPYRFVLRRNFRVDPEAYYREQGEILDWCRDQFGAVTPYGSKTFTRWCMLFGGEMVFVRDDNDAFAFKLRWL